MKSKIIIIAIFCLTFAGTAFAQQDPLYSQYMFNLLGINPAYAGSREVLSITGLARSQWVGVQGAPVSQVLMADFATKSKKVGLGMQVFNDHIGVMNTTGFNANYAYRMKLAKGVLALGIQGGFSQFQANYTSLQLSGNPMDPAFQVNANQFKPTVGAGLYYNTEKLYFGISAPHLIHNSTFYAVDNKGDGHYQNNQWFATLGYVFDLSQDINLKASTLVRAVNGAPLSIDLNANFWFYNVVSVGASFRTSGMIVAMLEFQVSRQFRFGYAYDYTSNWAIKNVGSHEIMLRYEFGFEKKGMVSPRFF